MKIFFNPFEVSGSAETSSNDEASHIVLDVRHAETPTSDG